MNKDSGNSEQHIRMNMKGGDNNNAASSSDRTLIGKISIVISKNGNFVWQKLATWNQTLTHYAAPLLEM